MVSSKRSVVWCLLLSGLLVAAIAAEKEDGRAKNNVVNDDCYERCSRYTGDQKFICIIGCRPDLREEMADGVKKSVVNDDCYERCSRYTGDQKFICIIGCRPDLGEDMADGGAKNDNVSDMPCKDYCMWYFRGPDRVQCIKDCRAPKADTGAGRAILQVV